MFVSASFGVLAKDETKFYGILFNQFILGLGLGIPVIILAIRTPYTLYRKYAFYIFVFSLVMTALVFIPGLGVKHGGATRWLSIAGFSFQPVEFLKIAFIMYFSAWIAWIRPQSEHLKSIVIPFVFLLGITATILIAQPDTKSLILIAVASITMLFVTKVPWKYILGIFFISIIGLTLLISTKSYLKERVKTFINSDYDPSGSSYQINQSKNAIGSGGLFGRGLFQSIQKFTYLPEPQGDSIFAVIGEELGFVGSVFTVLLYVLLALRGMTIAVRAPDMFSRLLVIGLTMLLVTQSFLNIASITGILPLTGVPLVFISHGGTALLFSLFAVGIILNISRYSLETKKL